MIIMNDYASCFIVLFSVLKFLPTALVLSITYHHHHHPETQIRSDTMTLARQPRISRVELHTCPVITHHAKWFVILFRHVIYVYLQVFTKPCKMHNKLNILFAVDRHPCPALFIYYRYRWRQACHFLARLSSHNQSNCLPSSNHFLAYRK